MGWERRNGRWYAYHSRRLDGRSVKEYLGRDDDRGRLRLEAITHLRRCEAKARQLARDLQVAARRVAAEVDENSSTADTLLRAAAESILYAAGYRRHHRSEWRMQREIKNIRKRIEALQAQEHRPNPIVLIDAPVGDAEAKELFDRARAGDPVAQTQLR